MFNQSMFEQKKIGHLDNCESKKYMNFVKGDTILSLSSSHGIIGLLLEGSACIVSIDENGRQNISDFLTVGDSFGEYIFMPLKSLEYIVVAESPCRVMFVNFDNVMNNCRHNCENHNELVKKLLLFTAKRAQFMSLHTNILLKKSLREKLLVYFEYLRDNAPQNNQITIPTTFESLASYLGADRSALMREIRRMNNDGIISSKGRKITLL